MVRTESEVFRNEVHSLFLRPFLDDAAEKIGRTRIQEMLAELGAEESQLLDQTAWVSLRFCEALFAKLLAATDDSTMFERCGRLAVSAKYAGILRPLFRAFGSPLFAFSQVVHATGRFNKIGDMTLGDARRGFVTVDYRPRPGSPPEHGTFVCQARAAQLGALPTMFDLAPADVTHSICLQRGGSVCRYEITWKEYGSRFGWRSALFGGLAIGAGTGAWLGAHGIGVCVGAAVGGLVLGSFVKALELRRTVAGQAANLADTHDALARSARFHELRFAQLTEAKAGVERKVEERTGEVREVNRRLESALEDLRALEEAERTFFANISHDLRTPLTLILAPLEELLAVSELPAALRASMETIQRNAHQLRRLIDQLLDLEKIQAGRLELVRTTVDIRMLVDSVVEKFHQEVTRRKLMLSVSSPDQIPLVTVDVVWMDSALMNLMSNAVKFARTKIGLRFANSPGTVMLDLEDDGPGVPEGELARIFDRFSQSGSARERRGGTGLGLAIAREAARLHGGTLTVRSELGSGTTFTLALPHADERDAIGSAPPVATSRRDLSASPPAPALVPDRGRRTWEGPFPDSPLVLVIEDDEELRAYLATTLSQKYRVEVAADGEEGVEIVRTRPPDAVVCDVAMPKMDGYEVCRWIRGRAETRLIPILLVTARRNADRVLEGFEAGANDYIIKPFHARELMARLEAHLLVRRLLRSTAHKERLATLGLLAASVAHQVRNPLSALKNTVRAIERKVTPELFPSSPEMFGLIAECTARIEKFTEDLLDISRVDGEGTGEFRPARGIESVIRLMSTELSSDVKISADIDHDIQLTGRVGDMNHVFMNLIDNAIRAVGSAGLVEIRAYGEDRYFVFEVADSGPGIPTDRREWIFEPFATTRSTEGTGLGLFIAKKIVFDHGGQISVDCSELGGAIFRVRVPLNAEVLADIGPGNRLPLN